MRILIFTLALFVMTATVVHAQARLGTPGYDSYEAGDYTEALKHWLPQAEAGDPDIQTRIAMMSLLGEGTEKSASQAAHWFMEASKQNFGKAQYQLGRLYATGDGVEQDKAMAFVLWSAAVENGATRSNTDLGELIATLTPNERTLGNQKLAEWWEAHPLPVEEVIVEVDNRTAMQKFNDWLMSLMPEGMVSTPK
ncbi:MAG TPA: sel1 repeat family protein [Sneathiellales bacterium]|jgi:TPR repeat protein|nr:sel1 repeat family protein [Sneathiellales bacterium]